MKTRIAIIAAVALPAASSQAARFTTAEVTRAINDVRLLLASGSSRTASVGSTVAKENSVLTGKSSRAELTFPDESIVRLGQNTSFSFLGGRREISLSEGTMLLQQPRFRGRTEIRTAAVSAAITGTTVIIESSTLPGKRRGDMQASAEPYVGAKGGLAPWDGGAKGGLAPPPAGDGIVKLLVLEGSLRFNLNAAPNKSMTLGPGEMVALRSNATELPRKLVFDLGQLQKTSGLLGPDFVRLPRADRIAEEVVAQTDLKRGAKLLGKFALTPARPDNPFGKHPANNIVQNVRNQMPEPPMPAPMLKRIVQPKKERPPLPPPMQQPMDPYGGNNNPPGNPPNGGPPNGGPPVPGE